MYEVIYVNYETQTTEVMGRFKYLDSAKDRLETIALYILSEQFFEDEYVPYFDKLYLNTHSSLCYLNLAQTLIDADLQSEIHKALYIKKV